MSHGLGSQTPPPLDASLPRAAPLVAKKRPAQPAAPRRSHAGLRTIAALMLREMSTRYGRSVGGYVWAVMEPLCAVFLLAIGFSFLIYSAPLGSNFFLFYASGYLPFFLYQQIALFVARAIVYSKPLLFYPAVSWLDAVLARFILNALTGILVSYLTLFIVMLTLETRTTLDVGDLLIATGLALALGFGVGVMNCVLMGLFQTWDMIWSIITKPLFLASGVLYIYEDMPRFVQDILWYNPLFHITGVMRMGLYPTYSPEYVSIPFVLGIALGLSSLGLVLLHRYHNQILQDG